MTRCAATIWALSITIVGSCTALDLTKAVLVTNLDRNASYRLRVTYASDSPTRQIRLVADDRLEIHPMMEKRFSGTPVEFDLPATATADGELTLSWIRQPGLGDNGRGCQVAEVWLIRK